MQMNDGELLKIVADAIQRYVRKPSMPSGKVLINGAGEICAGYCLSLGVNVRFVPLQRDTAYASLVRDRQGNCIVGLSPSERYRRRGYAIALFVISWEQRHKGFLQEYTRNCRIIDTPQIRETIRYLEQMLENMEKYMDGW